MSILLTLIQIHLTCLTMPEPWDLLSQSQSRSQVIDNFVLSLEDC